MSADIMLPLVHLVDMRHLKKLSFCDNWVKIKPKKKKNLAGFFLNL